MSKPQALVDYSLCRPDRCPDHICLAVKACPHKVLKQDGPGESPYRLAEGPGCGDCVAACPCDAIRLR